MSNEVIHFGKYTILSDSFCVIYVDFWEYVIDFVFVKRKAKGEKHTFRLYIVHVRVHFTMVNL